MEDMTQRFVTCECQSFDHLLRFTFDTAEKVVYVTAHLCSRGPWYKRWWRAAKYALGYRSRYGDYDEFRLDLKSAVAIRDSINEFISSITVPDRETSLQKLERWCKQVNVKLQYEGEKAER